MVGSRSSLRFRTGGLAWSRAWGRACGRGVAAALLLTAHPGAAQFEPIVPGPSEAVELELVLAVDASSSVSPEEFNLEMRSEGRRVGKGCVRPCRSRWSPYH